MTIEVFDLEDSENLIRIVYKNKLEDKDKTIWVSSPDAQEFFVERFKHNGISKTNVIDFMKKEDVKYKMEDYHVIELLKHYFI